MKIRLIFYIAILLFSCKKEEDSFNPFSTPYKLTKSINYNNIQVDVVIDKPANNEVDVLMTFHGTVMTDDKIIEAANNTLDNFKIILDRKDMMLVSVAYPEENLLMGDNILHSEAALLWVKNKADQELGIRVKNIFSRSFTRWISGNTIKYYAPNQWCHCQCSWSPEPRLQMSARRK